MVFPRNARRAGKGGSGAMLNAIFDSLTLLGALIAGALFLREPAERWPQFSRLSLLVILCCLAYEASANLFSLIGSDPALSIFRNYSRVAQAPFWLFLFYAFLYQRNSDRIRQNADRLHTILEAVQTGILVIDAEEKRIVNVNAIALEMLGRRREEVLGKSCHTFLCPQRPDPGSAQKSASRSAAGRVLFADEGGGQTHDPQDGDPGGNRRPPLSDCELYRY